MTSGEFFKYSINEIKNKCNEWDEKIWKLENGKKKSLELYNLFKTEIKQENYYNEEKSMIIFKIKTNTINLNERKRHQNESTKCDLCNFENENLPHFLLHCPALENIRSEIFEWQRPREENETKVIGKVISSDDIDETSIYELWLSRKRQLANCD